MSGASEVALSQDMEMEDGAEAVRETTTQVDNKTLFTVLQGHGNRTRVRKKLRNKANMVSPLAGVDHCTGTNEVVPILPHSSQGQGCRRRPWPTSRAMVPTTYLRVGQRQAQHRIIAAASGEDLPCRSVSCSRG